jgi:hypothetical protein
MRAVRRGDRVALTIGPRQLRGVAAAESPPARPTLGGSRSIERGYTGSRAVQPSSAQVRFRRRRAPSVRSRRGGVCHCASAQPCLDCSPTQAGQTLLGLAIPLAGRARWGLVGSVAACWVLLPCDAGQYGWAGLAGRGTNGSAPPGRRIRPASPDRRAGRGVHRARELARGPAVDPGPGGRLDAGELFAWVDGSSVSLTCSYADQGGCHVDMVVGADHRGRSRVAVWRGAGPPSPLTARRHQSARSQLALLLDQADGLAAWPVRPGPAGAADPQRCPARRARVPAPYCQPFSRSNTRETRRSNVVVEPGRPRGEASTRGQAVRATRCRPVAPGRESPQDPRHTPRRPNAGTPRPDRLREGPQEAARSAAAGLWPLVQLVHATPLGLAARQDRFARVRAAPVVQVVLVGVSPMTSRRYQSALPTAGPTRGITRRLRRGHEPPRPARSAAARPAWPGPRRSGTGRRAPTAATPRPGPRPAPARAGR